MAFEDPQFPRNVPCARVEEQLLSMFPLEDAAQFTTLRRGLMAFDETALFGSRQASLADDERAQGTAESALEAAFQHDAAALARAQLKGSFVELDLSGRRSYLGLWAQSPFRQRRQFYRGAKTLTMIATYSLTPLWQTIGYDGPVLTSAPAAARVKAEVRTLDCDILIVGSGAAGGALAGTLSEKDEPAHRGARARWALHAQLLQPARVGHARALRGRGRSLRGGRRHSDPRW